MTRDTLSYGRAEAATHWTRRSPGAPRSCEGTRRELRRRKLDRKPAHPTGREPFVAKGHPRRSSQQGPRRSRGVRRSSLQRPNAPTCWGQGGAGFRCSVLDGLAPATDRAAPAEQAGRLAQRRGMRSFGIGRSIDAPRLPAYFVPGVVMIFCDALPANGTGWHAGSGAPAGDTSWGLPEYPRLDFCAASRDSAAAACRQSSKNSTSDAHVCRCGPIAVQGTRHRTAWVAMP